MYRATTPTHSFELPFEYSEFVNKILITYKQGKNIVLEKTEQDISYKGNIVSYTLTQEETNLFRADMVSIQVRVLTFGGDSLASEEIRALAKDVLNDKVLK